MPCDCEKCVAREHELTTLRAEAERLRSLIDTGRAAHNEERAARDWLARENERLRSKLRTAREAYEKNDIITDEVHKTIMTALSEGKGESDG